jgi:hypothetical protein
MCVLLALPWLAGVEMTACDAGAQDLAPLPAQQQAAPPPRQLQQQPSPPSSSGTSPASDLFSIDRIRKEMERPPAISFAKPDPKLPVFRLTIEGYRFQMPSWRDNFLQGGSPAPQPPGGSDFHRMQALATGPVAWGTPTPFGATGPTNVSGPGMSGLLMALIKSAMKSSKEEAVGRAHAEVQQELADLAVHNARVAAGLPDDDGAEAKKAAEKKKQAVEKKKKVDRGGQAGSRQ